MKSDFVKKGTHERGKEKKRGEKRNQERMKRWRKRDKEKEKDTEIEKERERIQTLSLGYKTREIFSARLRSRTALM